MFKTIAIAGASFALGAGVMLGGTGTAAPAHQNHHIQVRLHPRTEIVGDNGPTICVTWERHQVDFDGHWSLPSIKWMALGACAHPF